MSSNALNLYDSSTPLLSQHIHPSASAFPQAGSWSWPTLIDSGIRGAVSVLSRYSAAGVDQYTVVVGQLLCTKFRLKQRGMERLRGAILNLRSMKTLGNILHFGFGVDSVVRHLAATVEGGILVALCAATMEVFEPARASEIFWELVRSFELPERRTPSPMQWEALLAGCAGVLSETKFPLLVEHLMNLCADFDNMDLPSRTTIESDIHCRRLSSAASLAEPLLAIGQVTTGELLCVSIVGGAEAGWLAAVAEWIFDLRVAVYDLPNGQIHHASSTHQEPQVVIHLKKPDSELDEKSLEVRGKVCYLRDVTDYILEQSNGTDQCLSCARVPWERALRTIFGDAFDKLMTLDRAFANALAAAATGAERESRLWLDSQSQGHVGSNFGGFAVNMFPELAPLKTMIDEAYGQVEAVDAYKLSIIQLEAACGCCICESGQLRSGGSRGGLCLVLLAETVFMIIRCMSGVCVSSTLCPNRSGILAMYDERSLEHGPWTSQRWEDSYNPPMIDWIEGTPRRRIERILKLFTGKASQRGPADTRTNAMSLSGIVVSLNCLSADASFAEPASAGGFFVMPGHIEVHGRVYRCLADLRQDDLYGREYQLAPESWPKSRLSHPSDLNDGYDSATLVALESSSIPKVGLLFREGNEDSSIARSFIAEPSVLCEKLLMFGGRVVCDGISCSCGAKYDQTKLLRPGACMALIEATGPCEVWLFSGNDISRAVALCRLAKLYSCDEQRFVVLQFEECLDCCVKAAQQSGCTLAVILSEATG